MSNKTRHFTQKAKQLSEASQISEARQLSQLSSLSKPAKQAEQVGPMYLVCWTDLSIKDNWEAFEDYLEAYDRYLEIALQDTTYSASLTVTIESTDYEGIGNEAIIN